MAAEAQIVAYSAMFGIQAWIFRFANIVGSRAGHGIIHDLILQLKEHPKELTVLGDGTQLNHISMSVIVLMACNTLSVFKQSNQYL